jgi:hypothetical protein
MHSGAIHKYSLYNTWERTLLYTINTRRALESIWTWRETYHPTVYIYKQRVLKHTITWVVAVSDPTIEHALTDAWSQSLTRIA